MKKILLVLLLSVILFGEVYTEKNTENVDDITINNKTGEPINGLIKMYYEDGKLKYDLPYKNGILDGVVKKYYGNGKIKSKTLYKNGIEEETNKIAKDTRRTCVQTYISGGLRFTSSANHRTVSIAHENDEL